VLVVAQRVKSASVSVDGELIASIGKGILALAAVSKDDTSKDPERAATKLLNMRLWDDENGARVRMHALFRFSILSNSINGLYHMPCALVFPLPFLHLCYYLPYVEPARG
jgi:D-Tyr-tRNAtyr deacylase